MNRVFLAGVCALAGLLLGLVSSNTLIGQQEVPRPPVPGRVAKYQLSATAHGGALHIYFLDTETGQLWHGHHGAQIGWAELGSPVRPVPKKK
jgi:hypothetical protein